MTPTIFRIRGLLFLSAALFYSGLTGSYAHEAPEAHKHPPEEAALEDEMKTLGRLLRKLNRQISKPEKKESSQELLATMKASAEKARTMEPHFEENVPATERPERVARFKELMGNVVKTIEEADAALDKSEYAAAKEKVSRLLEEKKQGHKEFEVEEE